mgnify:CR=1 FL=1
MSGGTNTGDRGFTLAELLVVIVVLGILATVAVFAVRGISDNSAETACATELDNLEKAQEMQFVLAGSYGDETALMTNGVLASASQRFDMAGDANSYTISVKAGADCTAGASGGGGGGDGAPPPDPTPPAVVMVNADALHGVPAWRYRDGDQGSAADQILVFGGAGGRADWVAADDADIATSRRTHFMDINAITTGQVDTVLTFASSTGSTAVVVYAGDDTGGTAAYIAGEVGNYSLMTLTPASFGGGQLAGVLAST